MRRKSNFTRPVKEYVSDASSALICFSTRTTLAVKLEAGSVLSLQKRTRNRDEEARSFSVSVATCVSVAIGEYMWMPYQNRASGYFP